MNDQEAREILSLYRPGTPDEKDSAFDQARQLAKTNPELARWFHQHCETYLVLRAKFQAIPIPPGLKEQILSERKIRRSVLRRYLGPLLAAAAVVALLIGIEWGFHPLPGLTGRFEAYRKRMTESALRSYSMDSTATNLAAVRDFLRQKEAPADYSLPTGLETAAVAGCVVSSWHGSPVSMICFKSGRPLPPGDQSDVWLFVIERKSVSDPPVPGGPVFARVNKATTVSWSDDKNTFLLAAVGSEAFVRKYLQ